MEKTVVRNRELNADQQAKLDELEGAYRRLNQSRAALNHALKNGGCVKLLFIDDHAFEDNVAISASHPKRVERLTEYINDVTHHQDGANADKYYGIVGVNDHTMSLVENLNHAKDSFHALLPDSQKERISDELSWARFYMSVLDPELMPRLSIQSLCRRLPVVTPIDERTDGVMDSLSLSKHSHLKAKIVSWDEAKASIGFTANYHGFDPSPYIRILEEAQAMSDAPELITQYDTAAREQGVVAVTYTDGRSRVQRTKKVSMPLFYNYSQYPDVRIRLARKQKSKAQGKGTFQGNRVLVDLQEKANMAFCVPKSDNLQKAIERRIKQKNPF